MSDRALYCHDDVNRPYPRVRDVLLSNPHRVLSHATAKAAIHAAAPHAGGAGDAGGAGGAGGPGGEIRAEVAMEIVGIENDYAYARPATTIALEWRSPHSSRIFPSMKASLVLFALTETRTQLELRGAYHPPMGKPGEVIDESVGYRLAEAAMTGFLHQVAARLREEAGDVSGRREVAMATPRSS